MNPTQRKIAEAIDHTAYMKLKGETWISKEELTKRLSKIFEEEDTIRATDYPKIRLIVGKFNPTQFKQIAGGKKWEQ